MSGARTNNQKGRGISLFSRRLAALGVASYDDYLRSDHWRSFSAAVRGNVCERDGCGARSHLQVHHVTYIRLGAELTSDVRTLCRRCHRLVHMIGGRSLDPAMLPPVGAHADALEKRMLDKRSEKAARKRNQRTARETVVCEQCGAQLGEFCRGLGGEQNHKVRDRASKRLRVAANKVKRAEDAIC